MAMVTQTQTPNSLSEAPNLQLEQPFHHVSEDTSCQFPTSAPPSCFASFVSCLSSSLPDTTVSPALPNSTSGSLSSPFLTTPTSELDPAFLLDPTPFASLTLSTPNPLKLKQLHAQRKRERQVRKFGIVDKTLPHNGLTKDQRANRKKRRKDNARKRKTKAERVKMQRQPMDCS